jgi:malonyl-CoA/methylmalonyl-CoA synthetase
MSAHLYDALTARFPKRDKPFLTSPDGRTVSYDELDEGSGRIASVLRDLGVEPGDRVAVQVEKSPEAVLLYLACLRAGAVFLPLNTAYTPAEVG